MDYRIKGGMVFDPDFVFRKHDVCIKDGVFAGNSEVSGDPEADRGVQVIDAGNMWVIPGLTDIHFHGCLGHDLCEGDPEVIGLMAGYEEKRGVTTICPATMTLDEDRLMDIMRAVGRYENESGAFLSGVCLEGPFISKEKCGAQDPAFIKEPDVSLFMRLQEASGHRIRIVTLAPEAKGAERFIKELRHRVLISFGHSAADHDRAAWAFENGVRHMTHAWNAMEPVDHRAPGPVIAAAENPFVSAELICDGVHIHPAVVRSSIKLFGEDRIIFISDSMEAAGMPDGEYELGGQAVIKKGNEARLRDGTIAGSASDLMDCMVNAVRKMGISLETAVRCSAVNPAKSIGIYEKTGSIEEGKAANLAILNEDLQLIRVISRGRQVFMSDMGE